MNAEAPPIPFAAALRTATWARHQGIDPTDETAPAPEPEQRGIIGSLLDGDLHLDDFTAWTAQQYFVYEALDEVGRALRQDPVAAPFVIPELDRMPAFDADLSLLLGLDWRDSIVPNSSTKVYCDRIRECATWPGGYIAHHYTRYMGDLSGGQAFRAAAADTYGFGDGAGVSFYIFDSISDVTEFKNGYRARLNEAPFDESERQNVIAEVLDAYDYNEALLSELGTTMRRSV